MSNKVCVYAICKNEAKFVQKWYDSMKEADYIVVLDTGSTDNTVDLLRSLGVTVEIHQYSKDDIKNIFRFDDARNRALALAPDDANILVSTDLDEVFEPGWANILRESWNDDLYERAEYSYIWRHFENGTPDVTYRYNKIHNRDWIWRTPVHEYLTRKADEKNFYYDRSKSLNLEGKLILHHYPDNTKSRGSYLPLLEIRARDYPDDLESLVYLAREYWFYDRFNDAINTFNKIVTEYADKFDKIHLAYSYLLIGASYGSLAAISDDKTKSEEYYTNAKKAYLTGIRINPEYMENYVGLSEIAIKFFEDYEYARQILIDGFRKAKRMNHWLEAGSNWTSTPLELLSIASYKLGDYKSALAYASKALSYNPSDAGFKHNYEICLDAASIDRLIE